MIAAVKRVSGVDFEVHLAAERPGDPASLIAGAGRIKGVLSWQPQLDDLDTIVAHALAWERHLIERKKQPSNAPELANT